MKLQIDTERGELVQTDGGATQTFPLHSPEAFRALSTCWLEVGWALKYSYSFTWFGRPIVQLPEDVMRIQEVIYRIQPDVILETGVAHGGSLIFYASLCKAMERGRVVGIDIEIRPHNRKAIESHPLAKYITLIEGSSVAPEVVSQAEGNIKPGEKTLILLDSNHSKGHVLAELHAYARLVTPGSYIVATDGIMQDLSHVAGGEADWTWNNPVEAVKEFLKTRTDFVLEEPPFPFNEGKVRERITYWPSSFIKRVRS